METKKKKNMHYQPIIPDDGNRLRKRVETISLTTGKKMYVVVREALDKGLNLLETPIETPTGK